MELHTLKFMNAHLVRHGIIGLVLRVIQEVLVLELLGLSYYFGAVIVRLFMINYSTQFEIGRSQRRRKDI